MAAPTEIMSEEIMFILCEIFKISELNDHQKIVILQVLPVLCPWNCPQFDSRCDSRCKSMNNTGSRRS